MLRGKGVYAGMEGFGLDVVPLRSSLESVVSSSSRGTFGVGVVSSRLKTLVGKKFVTWSYPLDWMGPGLDCALDCCRGWGCHSSGLEDGTGATTSTAMETKPKILS